MNECPKMKLLIVSISLLKNNEKNNNNHHHHQTTNHHNQTTNHLHQHHNNKRIQLKIKSNKPYQLPTKTTEQLKPRMRKIKL